MVTSLSFPQKPKKSSSHLAFLASCEPISTSKVGAIARILGTTGPGSTYDFNGVYHLNEAQKENLTPVTCSPFNLLKAGGSHET